MTAPATASSEADQRTEPKAAPAITPVPELTFHPLCVKLIPPQTDKGAEELLADIRNNKLQVPLMTYRGAILDGRGRYNACLKLAKEGVETGFRTDRFRGTTDEEARDYVISINLKRRHMSTSQRAMWAARMVTTTHGGDRKNQVGNLPLEMTQEEAAECFNVSKSLVGDAVSFLSDLDLVAKVDKGTMTVSAAKTKFTKMAAEKKAAADAAAAGQQEPTNEEDDEEAEADDSTTSTELSDNIDQLEESLIIALKALKALNVENAKAAAADIVRRFRDLDLLAA